MGFLQSLLDSRAVPAAGDKEGWAEYWCEAARYLLVLSCFNDAIACATKAIRSDPKCVHAYTIRAIARAYAGEEEKRQAEADFAKATEIAPHDFAVWNDWAVFLKEEGRYADAEPKFRKAIELAPRYMMARYNYGLMLSAMGRWKEAEVLFSTCLDLVAEDEESAAVLKEDNHVDDARIPILMARAEVRIKDGREEEGIEDLQRVRALDPNHVDILAFLVNIKLRKGDP